jgi:hypothetical protein
VRALLPCGVRCQQVSRITARWTAGQAQSRHSLMAQRDRRALSDGPAAGDENEGVHGRMVVCPCDIVLRSLPVVVRAGVQFNDRDEHDRSPTPGRPF